MKLKCLCDPNSYRDRFNLDSWDVSCPVCRAELYFDPRASLRGYAMRCDGGNHEYKISFKHEPRSRIKSNRIMIEDDCLILNKKSECVISVTRRFDLTRLAIVKYNKLDEIRVKVVMDIEKYNTFEKAELLFKRLAILK